jgi:non-homologous end joining protein Ku
VQILLDALKQSLKSGEKPASSKPTKVAKKATAKPRRKAG